MINLADYDMDGLTALMRDKGQKAYRAASLYKWLHSGVEFDEMTDFPLSLRAELAAEYRAQCVRIQQRFTSRDGTVKYLFALSDGELIEGVLMSYTSGNTLCVSCQSGCRMGCVFCASGADGFGRNLSAGEIAGQVIAVNRDLGGTARDRKINNIVLMGSGEPLDNYDNVVQFLRIIMAKEGLNMGQRCISLSTCGLAERIKRLADDGFSVNLTVSLHAVTDEARSAIMPVNKSNPIAAVMSAARYYFERTGRRIMFEYTLIKGRNSGAADARRLALLLRGISAHVNLILLNPGTDGGLQPLSRDEAETFKGRLEALGVNCTVRRALGSDIEGACGQLKRRYTART